MSSTLLVVGSVFVGIAALLHLFIFWMESITWSAPGTWRRFGVRSQEEADTIAPMAYNQGFYNGFLAVGAICGIILLSSPGLSQAGLALELFTTLCMVLAATVLVISNPRLARAALTQGAIPLIAIVLLAIGIFTA
jgi:putative membrane protein